MKRGRRKLRIANTPTTWWPVATAFAVVFVPVAMVAALILAGCGGNTTGSAGVSPVNTALGSGGVPAADQPGEAWLRPYENVGSELQPQLRAALFAEFERLGIDPDKVAAAAPSGSDNAVFDLRAVVLDPDGPPDGEGGGELPPTGIELRWTERSIGDYDRNGEVNISDLQPMGQYWQQLVNYDDPALHGGFDTWPTGDPDGLGAGNWRIARVDGDGNGEINISDITPIAQYWVAAASLSALAATWNCLPSLGHW